MRISKMTTHTHTHRINSEFCVSPKWQPTPTLTPAESATDFACVQNGNLHPQPKPAESTANFACVQNGNPHSHPQNQQRILRIPKNDNPQPYPHPQNQ
ncbi:MAG: hypothetical protein MJE68_19375 [Proteobacteria bacterium]|nr:hypothetical protein [Pseudomonadota bacterium]